MHTSSLQRMMWFTDTYLANYKEGSTLSVLDIGSYNINGTYKDFFESERYKYQGMDMTPGPNVDVVAENPYHWDMFADESFDIVISGQALEHAEFFWLTLKEISRVMKPGGRLCIIVPRGWERHRAPIDAYRFDTDGMIAMARYINFTPLHASTNLAYVNAPDQWYSPDESLSDSILVAEKPMDWSGVVDPATYKFVMPDTEALATGFVSLDQQPYEAMGRSERDPNIVGLIDIAVQSGFSITARILRQYTPYEIINSLAKAYAIDPETYGNIHVIGWEKYQPGSKSRSLLRPLKIALVEVKQHVSDWEWLHNRLEDDASRNVLNNLALHRMLPFPIFLKNSSDTSALYFDKSVFQLRGDEVFVDCGGYDGDVVISFINNTESYKRIYMYEPSSELFNRCRQRLPVHDSIVLKQAGVGANNDMLLMSGKDLSGTFVPRSDRENEELCRIVSLDEDIAEPVSFIKMDIEGFEIQAIIGASRHIRESSPKLAISVYHYLSDIWEIPRLIHSINPRYRFYLRQYSREHAYDILLYAVPM